MSKFVLNLDGGKKGLLINEKSLCKAGTAGALELSGQNGTTIKRGEAAYVVRPVERSKKRRVYRATAVR